MRAALRANRLHSWCVKMRTFYLAHYGAPLQPEPSPHLAYLSLLRPRHGLAQCACSALVDLSLQLIRPRKSIILTRHIYESSNKFLLTALKTSSLRSLFILQGVISISYVSRGQRGSPFSSRLAGMLPPGHYSRRCSPHLCTRACPSAQLKPYPRTCHGQPGSRVPQRVRD
jgi:hypothetical protein